MLLRNTLAGRKGPTAFRRGLTVADHTVQYALSKRWSQDGIHKWEWYLGSPKTQKALRGIAATENVMKLLADLKIGNAETAFVFPGDCHGFIHPDDFEANI